MLDGKLTVKGHLRMTEDMDREIEAIAKFDHNRDKQDMTRVLILLGIESWRKGNRGFYRRTVTPNDAQQELAMTPIAAKGRTMTQRKGIA